MRAVKKSSSSPAAVTVLITAYNRLDYLPLALASVYAQTFRDFRVVLVDDASTDGTREWVAKRKFPRLAYVRSERNRGPAAARNAALAEASGVFVAFLDSDDLWEAEYLEAMTSALEDGPAASCYATSIDSRGRVLERDFLRRLRLRSPGLRRALGLPFFPLPSATVLRLRALAGLRGFDEHFRRIGDDADFFYRLALRRGAFRLVPRNLVRHRRHAGQLTGYIERAGDADREGALDCAYFRVKHAGARA
ncbi:MAG: glycosyltransferase family 2 protein [Elusimicrobiota bacterium]